MSEERAPQRHVTRVFLVDDHEVVRSCVRDFLQLAGDVEVVGEDDSAVTAAPLIVAAAPDVAVVDLRLGDGSGIEVCRDVSAENPAIVTLVLTADDDERAAVAAVLAGARGYALKLVRGSQLLETVRAAAGGQEVLAPDRRAQAQGWLERERVHVASRLTAQQTRVLAMIVGGHTDGDIARALGTTPAAVARDVSALLHELGFPSRDESAADSRDRAAGG